MKAIRILSISIILSLVLMSPVSAITSYNAANPEVMAMDEVQPRVEEVRWYYRTVDGVDQMRLWSITYGKWLTDWMPVS